MEKPDEIREIEEKLAKIEEDDNGMMQFDIRIVKFRNLSAWLKTIITLAWVLVLYSIAVFITRFISGVQQLS